MNIRILHLYPNQMNIYGDMGNIIALRQRMLWRGIEFEVINVDIGGKLDIKAGDILFLGGGQDKGQALVADDLVKKSKKIKSAIDDGLPVLTICGGYQLFGKYFLTEENQTIQGIGVFDMFTKASQKRMIGNVVLKSEEFGDLVGFENHSGQTFLQDKNSCLGKVIKGSGNNGEDNTEGILRHNAIGTYMHGSFLPKNPLVADFLIKKANQNINKNFVLKKLDDSLENKTNLFAKRLLQ